MRRNGSSKVVVVTGASAGVGRATARAFGRHGARVGLVARGQEGLDAAKQEIESAGGQALVLPADVSYAEQVESAAQRVEEDFGPIDVWVNNAMVSVFSPFEKISPDEFRRVTEVTYLGYVYGTMSALRRMKPRAHGVIIQVGSALAYRGIPLQSAYCGAKHAIEGFSESVRCELLHDNCHVRITLVHMPALNTPQFSWSRSRLPREPQPVPPIYQPEVAADAIVWSASNERRELWVGGTTAVVIAGNKLAPGLGDHYLARTGYESQMTDEPVSPDRRDNLYEPVPGDAGARGRFGERSHGHSYQLWASQHRGQLAGLALAGGLLVGGLMALLNSERQAS